MQGRLSPIIRNRIQCFPTGYWQRELLLSKSLGFRLMEWTLDGDTWDENPVLTPSGRAEIRNILRENEIQVKSLTGDFFMEAPFFKAEGVLRESLLDRLKEVIESCLDLNIQYLVLPLVDKGRLRSAGEEDDVAFTLSGLMADKEGFKIIFESDFPPQTLRDFIGRFDKSHFGINYDTGNSAALGYSTLEELEHYADWVENVHIKDRVFEGTTVPLGEGNAEIPLTVETLERRGYQGAYILQTARAIDGNHAEVLCRYRDYVQGLLLTPAQDFLSSGKLTFRHGHDEGREESIT